MAWHYGTYKCGCEGRVDIVGRVKDRQWKADRHFDRTCYDCRNKENEEKAKEMGLPDLKGSEKQIAWANTLRQKFVSEFSELLKNAEEDLETATSEEKTKYNEIVKTYEDLLQTKVDSRFWIDNRNEQAVVIVHQNIEKRPN